MASKLGRYELGPEIGRGSMAVVYRAFDERLQRPVALKMLKEEYASSDRYRREFLSEAHAAGRLSHAGIVTIHDVGESGGKPFMTMELLQGETLQQRVEREGPLPVSHLLDIGVQLAEALDYAHRNGVIHRDVKADNVMILDDDSRVKLADFGIARLRQAGGQAAMDEGEVVGTPNYMAPEQVRGEAVDGRSDLYSLGVLLYRLSSGRLPFARRTTRATLEAILKGKSARLRPGDPETPAALVSIITTLMSRLPSDRYQSGAELAADLRDIQAELMSRPGRRWRIPLSVRWPVALGLSVALTLVVGSFAVYQHQRAAMTSLVFEYGGSMADVIATESAEDLLLGDHIALQAMVSDMQRNRQMAYLRLSDHRGEVVASSEEGELGESVGELQRGKTELRDEDGRRVAFYREGEAERYLFEAPILFRDRVVGELALGISARPLANTLRTSVMAMAVLMLATLLTVLLAAYVLSRRLRILLRVLGSAMDRLAGGHPEHRIHLRRRDEFGELFARFNLMAETLEATRQSTSDSDSPAGPPEGGRQSLQGREDTRRNPR